MTVRRIWHFKTHTYPSPCKYTSLLNHCELERTTQFNNEQTPRAISRNYVFHIILLWIWQSQVWDKNCQAGPCLYTRNSHIKKNRREQRVSSSCTQILQGLSLLEVMKSYVLKKKKMPIKQAAAFVVIRCLKSIQYRIMVQDVNFQELKYARSETPCRSWMSCLDPSEESYGQNTD